MTAATAVAAAPCSVCGATVEGGDGRCGLHDRDRCTGNRCGHLRLAHIGRRARGLVFPDACAVQICGCEQFRGEADR